eukprot:TRINITY_DN34327_c0_g1_i1.p1 TRINITY_DN34327_c0_g1~~TRINITY_DN34327_c0_g1_i1.p1  ORF type:complete len:305 (+),score=48.48 TRINITY_DN34327_c0_g1_i1:62-976(+)
MQLFLKIFGETRALDELTRNSTLEQLYSEINQLLNLTSSCFPSNFYLSYNGRLLSKLVSQKTCQVQTLSEAGLKNGDCLEAHIRVQGGKGGFGAQLRGLGRDGKITSDFSACRDLQGRRLRHVEAEKKLQEWQQEAPQRQLEKVAEQYIKQQEKLKKQEQYDQVRDKLRQDRAEFLSGIKDAVSQGLASARGQIETKKRRNVETGEREEQKQQPSKKRAKMIGFAFEEEESSSEDDDDDEEICQQDDATNCNSNCDTVGIDNTGGGSSQENSNEKHVENKQTKTSSSSSSAEVLDRKPQASQSD